MQILKGICFSESPCEHERIFIQVQELDSGRDCDRCWILRGPHATHSSPEKLRTHSGQIPVSSGGFENFHSYSKPDKHFLRIFLYELKHFRNTEKVYIIFYLNLSYM